MRAAIEVAGIIDRNLTGVYHVTDIVNNGMCIKVDGEEGLYIWVRLRYLSDKVDVDISNIILPDRCQRHGILSSIMHGLTESIWVRRVYISGACTPGIHKACKKFKMSYDRESCTYMRET